MRPLIALLWVGCTASPPSEPSFESVRWVRPGSTGPEGVRGESSDGFPGPVGVGVVSRWDWERTETGDLVVTVLQGRDTKRVGTWSAATWRVETPPAPVSERRRAERPHNGLPAPRAVSVDRYDPGYRTQAPTLATHEDGRQVDAWLTFRQIGERRGPFERKAGLAVRTRRVSGDNWSPTVRVEHLPGDSEDRVTGLAAGWSATGDPVVVAARRSGPISWVLVNGRLEPVELPALPEGSASEPVLTRDREGRAVLAFAFYGSMQGSHPHASVRAARLVDGRWKWIGDEGRVRGTTGAAKWLRARPAEGDDPPLVGWIEDGRLRIVGLVGDAWEPLGDPVPDSALVGPIEDAKLASWEDRVVVAWATREGPPLTTRYTLRERVGVDLRPLPGTTAPDGRAWSLAMGADGPVLGTSAVYGQSTTVQQLVDGEWTALADLRKGRGGTIDPPPLAAGESVWIERDGAIRVWTGDRFKVVAKPGPLTVGSLWTVGEAAAAVRSRKTGADFVMLESVRWDRSGDEQVDGPICDSQDALVTEFRVAAAATAVVVGWRDDPDGTLESCRLTEQGWARLASQEPVRSGRFAVGQHQGIPITWRVTDDEELRATAWNGARWVSLGVVSRCPTGCFDLQAAAGCVGWHGHGRDGTDFDLACLDLPTSVSLGADFDVRCLIQAAPGPPDLVARLRGPGR